MSNMYVVIQHQNGRVGHQSIGQALVEADLDASLTTLALRRKREPIVSFTVYSSKQAAEAIQELEELGDVDVDPRDFELSQSAVGCHALWSSHHHVRSRLRLRFK